MWPCKHYVQAEQCSQALIDGIDLALLFILARFRFLKASLMMYPMDSLSRYFVGCMPSGKHQQYTCMQLQGLTDWQVISTLVQNPLHKERLLRLKAEMPVAS